MCIPNHPDNCTSWSSSAHSSFNVSIHSHSVAYPLRSDTISSSYIDSLPLIKQSRYLRTTFSANIMVSCCLVKIASSHELKSACVRCMLTQYRSACIKCKLTRH